MAHFYLAEELAATTVGSDVVVTGPEARHAVTVSRVRPGETLRVGNGRGLVVVGDVIEAVADRLVLRATSVTEHPQPARRLVLVQALAKGDRDELAVQAATELGVDEVVAWAAGRSIARWEGAKVAKGLARWGAIVREATKQSLRPWAPTVTGVATTGDLVKRASSARVLLLEPTATARLADVDLTSSATGGDGAAGAGAAPGADGAADAGAAGGADSDLLIVVGPEGGLTEHEIAQLEAVGATAVKLGDSVLRTSTAGPAALAVLSVRLERW